MKNTKNTFASRTWNASVLATALIFALAGAAHAQTGSSAGGARSGQTAKAPAKSGSTAQKSQGSSGWDQYTYGKDPARDYARSQGAGPSGESSYTYGKNAGNDYAKSQGTEMGTAGGQASASSAPSPSDNDNDND